MEGENKLAKILDFVQSMDVPNWVSRNALTAFGKGIYGIVEEGTQIPRNLIANVNEDIKLKGELKREFVKMASQHQLKQIANDPEFAERILRSYGVRVIEEQINKETIANKTFVALDKSIKTVSDFTEPKDINIDWLTAFWNLAASKSESDIQGILSKILANEIIAPQSMSLHTLQTLSVLDSKVGNSFKKLCNLSIDDGETTYVIHPRVYAFQNIGPLDEYGISFKDLLHLDGANLIRSAETIMLNYGNHQEEVEYDYKNVNYAGQSAKLDISGKQLHLIFFTQSGRELRRLIEMTPVKEYTEDICEQLGESFNQSYNGE